jgi:Nucleoside 2-deoxyribosyltransferase/pfkB family carbohydrate kinase
MTHPHLVIVGGSYGEECAYPRLQLYRGSGGRAAALLASLKVKVSLHTITGPQLTSIFQTIASKLNYKLVAHHGIEDIWFRYRHPLGKPTLLHSLDISNLEIPTINSELALVYGMIEGRPSIHAKRAVYDPQDGAKSKPFDANGSKADDLAMVVSYSEGKALTGESDCIKITDSLLNQPNVSVVIVKCGPQGALVRTSLINEWVRPFPTSRVQKIGSGDVFSAAFAFAWLIEGQCPLSSAWFASRITAAYVESGQDSINFGLLEKYREDAKNAEIKFFGHGHKDIPDTQIYLAAPFFNTAEQWRVDEVREALKDMGFKVFSPIHDVGVGPPHEVTPADLFGLEQSSVVIALLDGLDPGTLFEVGYARGKSIPVVVVAESVDPDLLTMAIGSGCEITNDLATGIYAVCWHLTGDV